MRSASKALTISPSSTMSASQTSDSCDLTTEYGYSIQAVWTGTPTGSLKVQHSNDAVTWTDVTLSPNAAQALSGAAGNYLFDIPQTNAQYARLAYTFTSGTGVLTARFNGKGG